MIKHTEENVFLINGQKSALHCLKMEVNQPGVCAVPHYHKYCEILYGLDCDVDILIGEKTEKLKNGDICFIYPEEPHYMQSKKEHNEYFVIKFFSEILFYNGQSNSELYYLINILGGNNKPHNHVLTPDNSKCDIENIINSIFYEWDGQRAGYEFAIRGQILILYSLILRIMKRSDQLVFTNINDNKISLIHDAIIYTAENLNTVTESLLAKKCFMSNSNFSKVFKGIVGKSYKQFLKDARVAEAKKLLIATDKTITDIAYSLGFSSSSHFISTFRQSTGTTPLQYKNKFMLSR